MTIIDRSPAYNEAFSAGHQAAVASGDPRNTKLHDAAANAYLKAHGEEWEDAWLQGWWAHIDGKPDLAAPEPISDPLIAAYRQRHPEALVLEAVAAEEEAIDTGQLTRAQRNALLLYPGDGPAEREARALILAAPQFVGTTTGNLTTNPVSVEAMRLVAAATDESLKVPDSPSAQGWRFWVGLLQDVQKHVEEYDIELLTTKPHKAIPPAGRGRRILEHVSSSQAAQMVAEIDATEFSGILDPYPEYLSLEAALLGQLTAIYEAGWEVAGRLLQAGDLRVVQRAGKTPMLILA